MQTLQPTRPPKFQRAQHPLSVLGGLTLKQRKERHTYKPMPVEMHQYLAWAAGVSRDFSKANKGCKAFGAVTSVMEIEYWLDEIIQTETRLDPDLDWRQYYQWAHVPEWPIDEATCHPIYSLMLIFGLLEHTPDLDKMDPRYIKIRDLADFAIGKYSRGKARAGH